jgi:hypothetical protein
MNEFLPILSAILALISPLVYGVAIVQGRAKPHRTTRFVLLLIGVLTALSLFAHGDQVGIYLAVASAIQSITIFGLSLKYGVGGGNKIDIICLLIAVLGIVLWQLTNNPLVGLYFAIAADFTGMVPAILKTYRWPESEVASFFALDAVAALLILLALSHWAVADFAYPLYILVINGVMVSLILRPKK